MTEHAIQKPFLKWVGGKTQIIDKIISRIPGEINNYHEIFLGGGSVLLAVLSLQRHGKIVIKNKIYAYDINRDLINVYKHIQTNKQELYEHIQFYVNEYDALDGAKKIMKPVSIDEAKTSKESYYYWIRKKYNEIEKGTVECSALFMFINKTCFRGMYREGPNGFNVPYGHYKKTPVVITDSELNAISELIKDVEFVHSDFRQSMQGVEGGDFVYLDPPYAPETATSFVGYSAAGFTLEMHNELFNAVTNLHDVKIVMSNAKVELVTNHFKEYGCEDVIARRAINSKNPGSTTTEVVIYN